MVCERIIISLQPLKLTLVIHKFNEKLHLKIGIFVPILVGKKYILKWFLRYQLALAIEVVY